MLLRHAAMPPCWRLLLHMPRCCRAFHVSALIFSSFRHDGRRAFMPHVSACLCFYATPASAAFAAPCCFYAMPALMPLPSAIRAHAAPRMRRYYDADADDALRFHAFVFFHSGCRMPPPFRHALFLRCAFADDTSAAAAAAFSSRRRLLPPHAAAAAIAVIAAAMLIR